VYFKKNAQNFMLHYVLCSAVCFAFIHTSVSAIRIYINKNEVSKLAKKTFLTFV